MRTRAVAFAVLLANAPALAAEDLPAFLKAATAAARPTAPLRADGELITASPDGTVRDQIALIARPSGDLYFELRKGGTRALLLADGTGRIVPAAGKSADDFPLEASFAGSEFTSEDLRPFTATRYRSPSIADRNGDELTVSLTPRPSQYALEVITFDGPKRAPLVVKDYKDTVSNLIKMRRWRGLTSVGGIWLPSEVVMENFPLRATSTMTLRWQPVADQPALFDPAALDKPSALTWP